MKIPLINIIIGTLLFIFFFWKGVNVTIQWLFVCSVILIASELILFRDKSLFQLMVNCVFPVLFFFGFHALETWLYIGRDFGNMPYNYINEILIGCLIMYPIVLLSVWLIRFVFFKFNSFISSS